LIWGQKGGRFEKVGNIEMPRRRGTKKTTGGKILGGDQERIRGDHLGEGGGQDAVVPRKGVHGGRSRRGLIGGGGGPHRHLNRLYLQSIRKESNNTQTEKKEW